jgi:hypothetical protein
MKRCYFEIYYAATSASLCAMPTEGVSACLELLGIITRQPFLEASVRVRAAHIVGVGQHSSMLVASKSHPGFKAWAHRLSRCTATSRLTASPTPPQACLETLTKPRTRQRTSASARNINTFRCLLTWFFVL